MKLTPTKVTLASGGKLIAGYKIALPKSDCERFGFNENTELKAEFTNDEIRLKKI